MPGNFLQADVSYPDLSKYDSTEAKLTAIQNYLFLLLENLRYTLRNLSMEDNFNQAELSKWVDGLDIEANTIISNTVITNELYSEYGAIADLTVNELRTDYKRALRYLQGNTADLDYIHIHDEEIDFLTGTVRLGERTGQPLTEQLHHGDRYFWWRSGPGGDMTSLEDTGDPVLVYQYDELLKGTLRFETVNGVKIPQIVLGAGYGDALDADRGKGFLRKNTDGFDVWLHDNYGRNRGLFIGEQSVDVLDGTGRGLLVGDQSVNVLGGGSRGLFVGATDVNVLGGGGRGLLVGAQYTDLVGLRKPTVIDMSGVAANGVGQITVHLDGNVTKVFQYEDTADGCAITDETGHRTEVLI